MSTTSTEAKQHTAGSQHGEAVVNKTLEATDWNRYWERVAERVAKDVDAYELARARSLEDASHQVFL